MSIILYQEQGHGTGTICGTFRAEDPRLCGRPVWATIWAMNRHHPFLFALVALACAAGAACTTAPSRNEGRVERLVGELNTADEERVVELCALPFLLDGETIAREEDLRNLWRNLRASSFVFSEAEVDGIAEAGADSYPAFQDDPEVMAFFQRYMGKAPAVATVKTGRGTFLFLTGGRVSRFSRLPKLYGFTGPEGR